MSEKRAQAEISDVAPAETTLPVDLPPAEVLERLARASRRGLLPGFAPRGEREFRVEADAMPFGYELVGTIAEAERAVRLELRRLRRVPVAFAIVIALTIWPGVWLTGSLLATYWSAYGRWTEQMPWLTYAWYLPITVIPLPWMWGSMARRSRAEALESAAKQVRAMRDALTPRTDDGAA